MDKVNILFLSPFFDYKIWGGKKLKEFGYKGGDPIGEALVISALNKKESQILNKNLKEKTLKDFFKNHKDFFDNYPYEYPLLTKIIDANDDLSVQVHPDNDYAKKHFDKWGKTECWYILEADKNASIILGSKTSSIEEIKNSIKNNDWNFLKEVPVQKGDFINVPNGTIHAIKKGILTYELQQSSDLTFRLYDYNRRDRDGNLRELHIDHSLKTIKLNNSSNVVHAQNINGLIVENPEFSLYKFKINNNELNFNELKNARWLECLVINGSGKIENHQISKGSSFILRNGFFPKITGHLEILIGCIKK